MTSATSVLVTEPGDRSVLDVRTHDLPDPGEGEVQTAVAAAGVNFIDVYKRQGVYLVHTPFVLGEEGAGPGPRADRERGPGREPLPSWANGTAREHQ